MAPPRGQAQLDRAAWSWADDVLPEDVREEHVALAYRVRTPACRRGVCKSNCRGNPNCLVGVGERLWLGDVADVAAADPEWERREKGAFVGLTNLGATCYVNAFLQVWFNNLELRRSLYLCHGGAAAQDDEDGSDTDVAASYEPRSIWEHLQFLFALLQSSSRRCVDPSGLVRALGLDTRLQQDAQEFSKLFLTLLEDSLARQEDPALQKVIQRQFCGEFSYVTACDRCGRVSPLPSTFYELELHIQGLRSLAECLGEFLREEKLDGDNRYHCESCRGKQSATRRMCLNTLPPVLNLQLMRFVFDRQTGHKKKLNSYIVFPELLDMAPFLEGSNGEACLYELSTVLVHRGATAYSGHYLAHVKDAHTGDWYSFNDEDIEEGRALHLGAEEDLTASPYAQQVRKPRCAKGQHASKNAYMLVYKKAPAEEDGDVAAAEAEVPAFLQRLVDRDNGAFEERCAKMAEKRNKNMEQWKEVRELYEMMPAGSDDSQPYEFLPTEWLKAWLDESAKTAAIDNSPLLCAHRRLHPDRVRDTKRVSLAAARLLYDHYGGGPRLDAASALCRDCVVERCRVLQLKGQLQDDYRRVAELVKGPTNGEGFWVGKASLKAWQRLALKQLEEDEQETKHDGNGAREYGPNLPERCSNYNEEETRPFNEDIQCHHGTLSTLGSARRAVSAEAWAVLRTYFPRAPEFAQGQQVCPQCVRADQEEKAVANAQKNQLPNLFKEKARPQLDHWPRNTDTLYMVPKQFVDEWRKFVQKPSLVQRPKLDNSVLLCPHGGFMFTFESLASGEAKHVALLWPNEWEVVKQLFRVDQTVSVHRTRPALRGGGPTQHSTRPGLCQECREGFVAQRHRDLKEYVSASVTVRKEKMTRQEEEEPEEEPSANSSGSDGGVEDDDAEESPKRDADESPMEVDGPTQDLNLNGLKLNNNGVGNGATSTGPAPHVAVNNNNNNKNNNNKSNNSNNNNNKTSRRSGRKGKRPEEKVLTISANQTLWDLKIQILGVFTVAPMDQNLWTVDGRRLADDKATLGSLGVTPNSVIVLKADEPVADFAAMYDVYQVGMPEAGFKGTGLLGY